MTTSAHGVRDRLTRPVLARGVALLAFAVLVGSLAFRPATGPTPTQGAPSPFATAPVAQATPGATLQPTASPEPWEDLVLDPVSVMATLTPEQVNRTGVATTTKFTLQSRNGRPAVELAAGLEASPVITFRIVPGATPDLATLEPVEALEEGRTYRLRLTDPDGVLGGSWAFHTQQPLLVQYTLPGDRATDVPINTGIEVTFDQDGTQGVETRFHVEPKVAGRFEQHGRTWAFIPDTKLAPATAYRVTLDAGVSIDGAEQVLEAPVTFRFETRATAAPEELEVDFESALSAIRPGQEPSFLVSIYDRDDEDGEAARTPTLPVRIYRLPTLARTMDAAARLTGPSSWLRASGAGLVPTGDLVRVASLDVSVGYDGRTDAVVLAIPIHLDRGAYVVEVPREGRPAQALLQVTNLAAYALASDTSTVVWVNDLATVLPLAGATVRSADGERFGVTNADGVATFATPPLPAGGGVRDWEPQPRLVSIRAEDGRWLVAALGGPVSWLEGGYDNSPSYATVPSNRWWLVLHLDRDEYRRTDTIHVSGLIRARDGAEPTDVELRLSPAGEWGDGGKPAIAVVRVEPSRSGAFLADIPFTGLPFAMYSVDLFVDGVHAGEYSLAVSDIRKPSYRLDVQTDRHAYRVGEPIEVTIRASFFDGSIVPALELAVDGDDRLPPHVVSTNADGIARLTVKATPDEDEYDEVWDYQDIGVAPLRPEEGEIDGHAGVIVLPSNLWLSTDATLAGKSLDVSGTASHVAYSAIDAAHAAGTLDWPYSAATGGPWAGRQVTVRVIQRHVVRSKTGTEYDYLEKKVIDVYRYDVDEIPVGTFTTVSATDGSFHLSITVPSATDTYLVWVRAEDGAGRVAKRLLWVEPPIKPSGAQSPSYLIAPGDCGFVRPLTVGLGSPAQVTLHDGDGRVATEGRFLFIVGNRGISEVTASASSTFSRPMGVGDLPGFTIRAVQVTAQGYATADALVDVNLEDLQIDVQLTPVRARYAPGDRAQVRVLTRGPDGQPIPADVIVGGVDEKLYAIGAAHDSDVLPALYQRTSSGFLQSFASHRILFRQPENGCGDEGGDGRSSFGDVVTSQFVRTGADGRATIEFDLLDDLTSWRLTAIAFSDDLLAGRGNVLVPVGLPFFVESVLAPEYLVGELPVLRARAYGEALDATDAVRFTVSAPSLGLAETTVEGWAFRPARVALPALTAGVHRIRIAATGPDGLKDAVIREIRVIPTRLSTLVTTYDELVAGYVPKGGDGLTTYVVVDAGRGSLISTLSGLAGVSSARFDRLAAADAARRLLIEEFGYDPDGLPAVGFDAAAFQPEDGVRILPYGEAEPELTALAALIVPDRLNIGLLQSYFRRLLESDQSRETRLLALAGLAAIGDDVLHELVALAAEKLTIRESLWLGLAFLASGDENAARAVERAVLEAHGERFGPWVRLAVGSTLHDSTDAGRLLLVLSARLGEPFARDVLRYLDDHPTKEHALALERLAYVQASLERLPRSPGQFAWTLAGERHVEAIEPGGSYQLVLTAEQRATFALEPLAGRLEVVTTYIGPAAELPSRGGVTLTRTVTPAGGAGEDQLIRVVFTVSFGTQSTRGCWVIRETIPSGLQPIGRGGWYGADGQHLSWCKTRDDKDRTVSYVARVVTPGTYAWEPAVFQAVDAPELGAFTPAFTYTIR